MVRPVRRLLGRLRRPVDLVIPDRALRWGWLTIEPIYLEPRLKVRLGPGQDLATGTYRDAGDLIDPAYLARLREATVRNIPTEVLEAELHRRYTQGFRR